MASYINKAVIRTKALRGLEKRALDKELYRKVNAVFQRKKNQLINDFENHPVSQEIRGGPNSPNLSGTLGGYGNLYTFIGFDGGNPVGAVSSALRSEVRLGRTPLKQKRGLRILYTYRVTFPDTRDLAGVAPMPWEPGNWVDRIERGISGLGSYIYANYISASRSGKGIQAKGKVRQASYSRTTYMSAIFATFKRGWRL